MRPWVSDGDELRKTLFASLLAGDRSIAFDNVPTAFKARAPELCAFITSNMWQDRRLGVSETISIPNRAVVSASGNNVTPVGDLARRSLVVRLDGNSEKLKARTFKIKDLRTHVLENRPQMLIDALTIIQAYALAGKPMEDQYLLDSFERWSRLVRQPMLWLNWVDPCETQADETDDETHELKHIFEALHTAFGTKPFTCVDISKLVGSMLDAEGALHTMLVNSGCQEPSSQKSVGYWIRTVRDKTAADLKLIHCGVSKFGARWQLQPINSSEDLA